MNRVPDATTAAKRAARRSRTREMRNCRLYAGHIPLSRAYSLCGSNW
jgi:hypothetical protein